MKLKQGIIMESSDISFKCDLILQVMEDNFENLKAGRPLTIPSYFKNSLFVYFFQEKFKPKHIQFPKLPDQTVYIDMTHEPSKSIELIKSYLKKDTNGFIDRLDEGKLKDPSFTYLFTCILYLKGKWIGKLDKNGYFYNANGTVKENVPFFILSKQSAWIEDDRLVVSVNLTYFEKNGPQEVRFSKPIPDVTQKYCYVNAHIPIISVESCLKKKFEDEEISINLKYKQDENGFEAAVHSSMYGGGLIQDVKEVYFNDPFKIEIFGKIGSFPSKNYKFLEIDVYNL